MSQQFFARKRGWSTRLVIAGTVVLAIVFIAIFIGQRPENKSRLSVGARTAGGKDSESPKQLAGSPARAFMQETTEGQSLMQAVTTARFGLKHQDSNPISGRFGPGYLGMSHDENLNVWFGDEGATIRPTLSSKDQTWQFEMKLKAYGYGDQLTVAPPIISHQVNENRIEYLRRHNESTITEWYVNESAGIEQGFTLNERPARADDGLPTEPLRLVVSVIGDLRARAEVDGRAVELYRGGQGILSYSDLLATDNTGKKLTARMETNEAGDEIALLVDDAGAEYPIVVDPVTATQKQKLDAGGNRQADARFGFAVAISGAVAIAGAWREDLPGAADAGGVYVFLRSAASGNWTLLNRYNPDASPGAACGWSVDIRQNASEPSDSQMMYGCPGASNGIGRAFLRGPLANRSNGGQEELIPFSSAAGDAPRHGTSVALGNNWYVGAPAFDSSGLTNNGIVTAYNIFDASKKIQVTDPNPGTNDQFGTSIAANFFDETSSLVLVVGAPGVFSNTGTAAVFTQGSVLQPIFLQYLQPNNADLGANFGNCVALSGDTVVVGAPFDDNERGTAAGAAYVFVRGTNGTLSQQQKLMASNGRANDHFSEHAVAVEGHLIVVGANGHDHTVGAGFDVGAAYLFSRQGTVWTEETTFAPSEGFGATDGDQFGIGVGISADTMIVGARAASALDNTNVTGAAYTYGIGCIPAYHSIATIGKFDDNLTVCQGTPLTFQGNFRGGTAATIQWRRNGVNIPGATSTSLSITASIANDGAYDFVASNACGSETSSVATLTVLRFTLSPTGQNIGAAGSDGLVKVTTGATCGYSAISNDSWIHITSNANGNSPQDVGFHVDANTGPNQRVGSITVGDKNFSISQDGINCSYSISPSSQNFISAGGANSVGVTATAGCAWNAASNDSWISVAAGSGGTGNGTLNYTVAVNTGPQRTGTLTVAGQSFTVTQASGCTFSINPVSQNFTAAGGLNSATVTAGGGCAWTATSNSSFVTLTSGSSGSGNGTVNYSVSTNVDTTQRMGSLTIAGQTLSVTQDGAAAPTPTPTPTPAANVVQFSSSNYSVVEDCTTVTITVNRVGDTSTTASVDYSTSDASATERRDYITALGKMTFAPGETSKSFAVLINEDAYVEGTETFNVSLSNPSGVSLGAPVIATVNISDDASEPGANVTDDPQTFVCQNYHDFLNRQPDPSGLNFWTSEINSCGGNQACIELKRVNVSAAFFLSIEFQQTGYLVERLYKTAYGNANGISTFGGSHQLPVPIVRFTEFLSDTQRIGQGVVVGQTGWEAVLENNKQAFTAEFVQRSRFTTALPLSLTAAQFVDTLNANSGSPLSQTERDQLVNDLAASTKNRAQVLRLIAEDSDLVGSESNRAFVLMQFYGYLRRNPNDPQDPDYTGYDFWLTKLSQFNGDFVGAEMVKAFINSSEYRQRFGP